MLFIAQIFFFLQLIPTLLRNSQHRQQNIVRYTQTHTHTPTEKEPQVYVTGTLQDKIAPSPSYNEVSTLVPSEWDLLWK